MTQPHFNSLPILDGDHCEFSGSEVAKSQDLPTSERQSNRSQRITRRHRNLPSRIKQVVSLPQSILRALRGKPQLPRVLTHTLTFGCNAKCVMCDSWRLPRTGELTLEEIRRLYNELPRMDVVRLTGGEPFVRSDLSEIADAAINSLSPFLLHISSNGFMTDRIIRFCESRNPKTPLELAISIDGVDGYHDAIRGHSKAWDFAWKTVSELSSRQRELNLHLVVNQTVTDTGGLEQYALLHERLCSLDVEHHFVVAYAESATYSLERNQAVDLAAEGVSFRAFSELDKTSLEKTIQLALKHSDDLRWPRRVLRRYYLKGISARLLGQGKLRNPTCQALHTHLRVFPNGDIPVCQFNSKTLGNVRDAAWIDLWWGQRARDEREWVRKCLGCWAECEVAPSALYTLDVLRSM